MIMFTQVGVCVFDKTGTVTLGKPVVNKVIPVSSDQTVFLDHSSTEQSLSSILFSVTLLYHQYLTMIDPLVTPLALPFLCRHLSVIPLSSYVKHTKEL